MQQQDCNKKTVFIFLFKFSFVVEKKKIYINFCSLFFVFCFLSKFAATSQKW